MIFIDDNFIKQAHDYNVKAAAVGDVDLLVAVQLEAWLADNLGQVFDDEDFKEKYTEMYYRANDRLIL